MLSLRYTIARTPQEIADAQRVRLRVYVEEERLLPASIGHDGREIDARDDREGTTHFLVYVRRARRSRRRPRGRRPRWARRASTRTPPPRRDALSGSSPASRRSRCSARGASTGSSIKARPPRQRKGARRPPPAPSWPHRR